MSYQQATISELIKKAVSNRICLPAIQRKFVWKPDQVEDLFDSLYRGFPIGTFLFWDMKENQRNDYLLYKLLSEYDEKNGVFNTLYPMPVVKGELWSVLDGQQRITSLFLSLQSHFRFVIKSGKKKLSEDRFLYFNLMAFDTKADGVSLFSVKSEAEVKESGDGAWILVKNFLDENWSSMLDFNQDSINKFHKYIRLHPKYHELIKPVYDDDADNRESNRERIRAHTKHLWRIINEEKVISYFLITKNIELPEVTEIFIRTNNQGTQLSKTDLLFSTVISSWQRGRKIIDELIKNISSIGYSVDTDFIMRTCLYLINEDVLFKVKSFNKEVVNKIILSFSTDSDTDIKTAIFKTFDFIRTKLDLSDKTIKSKNSLIPLIFHIYKGGNTDTITSVNEIKKYLFISHLQKVFGSHGDSLLTQLRKGVFENEVYKLYGRDFHFNTIISGIGDTNKKMLYNITDETIEQWLDYEKGNDAWMVLSLIYSDLYFEYKKYDQDHLHPRSTFKKEVFGDKYAEMLKLRDTVPNLCLLSPEENRWRKADTPLNTYINEILRTQGYDPVRILENNFIDQETNLELKNFEEFYKKRRLVLKNRLKSQLSIQSNSIVETLTAISEELCEVDMLSESEESIDNPSFNNKHLPENQGKIAGIEIPGIYSYVPDDKGDVGEVFENFRNFIIDSYYPRIEISKLRKKFASIDTKQKLEEEDILDLMAQVVKYLELGELKIHFHKSQNV